MSKIYKLLAILGLFITMTPQTTQAAETKKALFAGGCFWCLEVPFEKLDGVVEALSGFAGGHLDNPTYNQVSHEETGHYEVVEVEYDPTKITYQKLLEIYWSNVDPFDAKGQFCDKGTAYLSAIFYGDENELELAKISKEKAQTLLGETIVTELLPAAKFYPAEEYHQNYHKKNPIRYKGYRWNCGRDKRLDKVWGDNARTGVPLFD